MIILRSTLRLLPDAFPVDGPLTLPGFGVVPVITFSSALTDAIKAIMMAFLSTASFSCATIAFLSASEQVPIVNVGALQFVTTSVLAGLFEMVVVQVVIVVVMVEQACCCLLPRSLAW